MSEQVGLECSAEDGGEWAVRAGMALLRFCGMSMNVGLKCLVQTEGSWTDGASEWAIGGCGIIARHCSGSEVVDDSGIELVGVREMEIKASVSMESFGTEGTIVEVVLEVEKGMVSEVMGSRGSEGAMRALEMHQQKSTFLIPSHSILLHLIPLILGVRRE